MYIYGAVVMKNKFIIFGRNLTKLTAVWLRRQDWQSQVAEFHTPTNPSRNYTRQNLHRYILRKKIITKPIY